MGTFPPMLDCKENSELSPRQRDLPGVTQHHGGGAGSASDHVQLVASSSYKFPRFDSAVCSRCPNAQSKQPSELCRWREEGRVPLLRSTLGAGGRGKWGAAGGAARP